MKIEQLIQQFDIKGEIDKAIPFGSGHINDTLRLYNRYPGHPDYLLQRINHQVFPPVGKMMENIRKVTQHINSKSKNATLKLIATRKGENYFKDDEGNYWRMYIFMDELLTYDVAETPDQIYEGAKAFGRFLLQLSDFPVEEVFPTIPDFHNLIKRLISFNIAVEKDVKGRVKKCSQAIQYVRQVGEQMSAIQRAGQEGEIPLRITHNDTKFNNVLLDKEGRGCCVIDLDTVMPGYVHYDFGDGVRTTASAADEDEVDLDKIKVSMARFEAFARGYLEVTHSILTPTELKYLPISGAMLAYLMGVRFLTDYLQGDIYYKVHFEEQNFQRARAQLDLTRKLMDKLPQMEKIVGMLTLRYTN